MSSAIFNTGGGYGGDGSPSTPVNPEAPKQVIVNPNATPAEIMAAWKASLQSNGQDPDQEFTQMFMSRR